MCTSEAYVREQKKTYSLFKAEFRGRWHELAQKPAGGFEVEGTIATKRRAIEFVWEELVTVDGPSIRNNFPSTVIVAVLILPWEGDVVELDEFLGILQVNVAVQKAYTKFSLELILLNHGIDDAALGDKALLTPRGFSSSPPE